MNQPRDKTAPRSDKRRQRRRAVYTRMRVAVEGSSDFIDCTMTDLSAGGARLELRKGIQLPDYFVLVLSHDGRLRRQCSVAWRTSTSIGVEFIPFDPMNKSGTP